MYLMPRRFCVERWTRRWPSMAEKAVSSMKTQSIQQARHTGLERQQCFDLAVQVRELLTVLGLSFFGAIWRQWGWRRNDDTTSIDMIADSVKRWKAGAQKVFSAYCRPCQKPVWYERTDAIWGDATVSQDS